ncbi:glycerate kinase [Salinibacillus xinjiangensis]|uniref:Glycerate kinase n=1 Tax=Salinibacillus xinjiangensis TaxID=1229268 RepID=A0A6G1X211_9BACI|nr:glycerate kinase [Salinibacillus xinjiangensis]MRG84974.1 glycerate kinase [Salinibacillus xinjiangensis]
MKVLIAMDSFKGSISSIEGSKAISQGIHEVYPAAETVTLPLADGGEGTVEALVHATSGQWIEKSVTGPLGEPVEALYGISGDGKTAIIEVAAACGLPLIPRDSLDPLKATTYGVGELILDAIDKGCRHFIVGLGGSATNDAGVGMLQELGFRFENNQGEEVGYGGGALADIEHINTDNIHPSVKECTFQVACDVKNFLHGTDGAAYVYGPQKGATDEMVRELDEGLKHFAERVRDQLDIDIHSIEGAGAAGGLGAAFSGFLNGQLQSGIELVLEVIDMEKQLQDVDFVITGEGMLDGQTSMGKAPIGVAQMAKKHGIPVIALAGAVNQEQFTLNDRGMTSCFSILSAPMSLDDAMNSVIAYKNLQFTTNQLFRLIKGSEAFHSK